MHDLGELFTLVQDLVHRPDQVANELDEVHPDEGDFVFHSDYERLDEASFVEDFATTRVESFIRLLFVHEVRLEEDDAQQVQEVDLHGV